MLIKHFVLYRDADPLVPGSDYINANYIRQEEDNTSSTAITNSNPHGFKQYIATQVSHTAHRFKQYHTLPLRLVELHIGSNSTLPHRLVKQYSHK
jgi:hypothetical protein